MSVLDLLSESSESEELATQESQIALLEWQRNPFARADGIA